MSKNQKIAEALNAIADILELEEVKFKPQAYRNAAINIENLSEDIEEIAKAGKLEDIPGVGKSIAEKIAEILKTGHLKYLEQLKKKMPIKVEELMHIGGIGPKTIKKLYEKLGVRSQKELERAAKSHKIRQLEGFGETVETNILQSIEFAKKTKGRQLLSYILPEALRVVNELKKANVVDDIEPAGSIRRKKPTIGDIDILATAKNPDEAIGFFTKMREVGKIVAKGGTKGSVVLHNGLQIDLRMLEKKSWGSGLLYFTGSKNHNIHLRKVAISRGYKLSEYGLFKWDVFIAGKTEEEIYRKLGMQYIEPELREDSGEIEAALQNKLPKLVKLKDIQGDLHAHSKASDGTYSIREMAEAAKKHGLKYIAITDHTGNLKIAGGLAGKDLLQQREEIAGVNKSLSGIKVLSGAEVNIQDDGSLEIKDDVLKKLDVVVASIHSGFKGSKEKLTRRICTAMENPNVKIIGHPTGRILQRREGYSLDFEMICKTARKTGTCLEINAYPNRLDLSEELIKKAIEKGAKLALGTDAHSIEHYRYMEYGVYNARRGWCRKQNLANTRNVSEMLKWLEKN